MADRLAERDGLPGVPLESGFNWRPATKADELPPEAKARIAAKFAEFDRAQRIAWASARTAVIG